MVPIHVCLRGTKSPVTARQFKAQHAGRAVTRMQSLSVAEVRVNRLTVDLEVVEFRSMALAINRLIDFSQRQTSESFGDGLLVPRVNVVRIADVDGRSHEDPRLGSCLGLCFS